MSGLVVDTIRTFDADPADLFRMFADPHVLAQWWGPEGFRNEFNIFDFQNNGDWRFTMLGPDGAHYDITKVFDIVDPPRRIPLRHIQTGHDHTLDMTFTPVGGGTELRWHMVFADDADTTGLADFLPVSNEQNFDRLAQALRKVI